MVPTTFDGPEIRSVVGDPKVKIEKFLIPSPTNALSSAVHSARARPENIVSSIKTARGAALKPKRFAEAVGIFAFGGIDATFATLAPHEIVPVDEKKGKYFKSGHSLSTRRNRYTGMSKDCCT